MTTNRNTVQFTPIETGDLNEIPPDLPAGSWVAELSVKRAATKVKENGGGGGYPMLILNWRTLESTDGENDNCVGKRVSDMLTFFPRGHKGEKMGKIRLKALCDALEIEVPSFTKIDSWDDLEPFIEELEAVGKAPIYTSVSEGTDGVKRTNVRYSPPVAAFNGASHDDEDETPTTTTTKKTNGKKNGKK